MKTLIVVFAIAFVCLSLHKLDEKDIIRGTYSIHKGLEKSVESSSFEPDGKYLLYGTKVNDTFHHLVAYDPDTGVSLRFTDFYHRDHITQV